MKITYHSKWLPMHQIVWSSYVQCYSIDLSEGRISLHFSVCHGHRNLPRHKYSHWGQQHSHSTWFIYNKGTYIINQWNLNLSMGHLQFNGSHGPKSKGDHWFRSGSQKKYHILADPHGFSVKITAKCWIWSRFFSICVVGWWTFVNLWVQGEEVILVIKCIWCRIYSHEFCYILHIDHAMVF